MTRDYAVVGNWCIDAHSVIAPELSEEIGQMFLDTIIKHAGKPAIIPIAQELAECLNDLPVSQKSAAQEALRGKYGFGFDYFIQREQLRLAKIIARGKIRNEREHRAIIDALSDTTLDSALVIQLNRLLASHENQSGAA